MSIKNGHDYLTYGNKPNVIPPYESGLAGLPLILEISMIIPIIHISGMIPVLRILFNSFKYNAIHKLIEDLIYSLMRQSCPGALSFF